MLQKDLPSMIASGRQYLRWVCIGACLLALMNVGMGILYDNNAVAVMQQTLVLTITAVFSLLLPKKPGLRWYFFAWLILMALGLFFQGGQRGIYQSQDGGLAIYLSVLGALGLIGSAIFLGGSTEINAYFDSLRKDVSGE
jgi:hypothetical protein